MAHFYDAERWRAQIAHWAEALFDSDDVRVTQAVPSHAAAALAYEVAWSVNDSTTQHMNLSAVTREAEREFGPLALITECDLRRRTLNFCVLDMPDSAKQKVMSIIEQTEDVLGLRARWSLKSYALLFGVSLVEFAVACILLHNHWHAYEEPWETPLEFVYYHLPSFLARSNP